jgi:predicted HicB family RNase H-like nuclease
MQSYRNLLMTRPKAIVRRKPLGIRINPEMIKQIKHLAIDKGIPLNILVEEAIEDIFKKYKYPPKQK